MSTVNATSIVDDPRPMPRRRVGVLRVDEDPALDIHAILLSAGLRPEPFEPDFASGSARVVDAVVVVADESGTRGLAAVRRIRRQAPRSPIVVVASGADRPVSAREVLNAGAEAYLPARSAARLLVPALEAAIAGFVCAPRDLRRLIAKPTFSHREKQILGLLVEGHTNRQIGARLFLAESTVKSHLASAFAKLGVRSRKDAVSVLLDRDEGLAATALPRATHRAPTSAS